LRITLLEAFRRACLSLPAREQAAVLRALLSLETALQRPQEHTGIGLRKLHPAGIWEARVGLDLRIVFRLREDEVVICFLGTHDEVRRFLRSF